MKASQDGKTAQIRWTGNWVTFLDAMLQCAILADDLTSLRLPVRLRYLRIDPEKHRSSAKAFDDSKDEIQYIEAVNDLETQGCYAGGIEICELVAQSVARRPQASNVTKERVAFVPYYDDRCLTDDWPRYVSCISVNV